MAFLNEILDNREIAIIIWLGILFIWAIFQKSVRKAFVAVFKSLTQKAIFISMVLMLFYIGALIYCLYRINLWDISNLSDTVIWFLGVAFVMFMNINNAKKENYFRKVVWDNIKLVVFIEFVTNLYVLDLWAEMILVPIMALIGGMMGVASTKPEYSRVESFLEKVVGLFGIGFIVYTFYNVFVDFSGFASLENLRAFLLPLILTIAFLPFIYILALYVVYEMIFMRLSHLIKDSSLARYAKWKTIFAFHLNLQALNKWLKKIVLRNFENRDDVKREIIKLKMGGA
jgi:hypothetical protein